MGLLGLEPVESGGKAEDAHEAGGRLLVAGRNRAPLFQPRPEPLHVVAIVVDPLRTGYRGFVLLGRDRRTRTQVPDVLAEGVIRIPGDGLGLDSWAAAKRVGWCAMSRGGEPWRALLVI